jgi:hypothetical protein
VDGAAAERCADGEGGRAVTERGKKGGVGGHAGVVSGLNGGDEDAVGAEVERLLDAVSVRGAGYAHDGGRGWCAGGGGGGGDGGEHAAHGVGVERGVLGVDDEEVIGLGRGD